MNSICVQDPMMISHNVAEFVDYKNCRKLQSELVSACEIFQDNSNFSPSSSNWGLLTLLDKPNKYISHSDFQRVSFSVPVLKNPIINEEVRDTNLMTAKSLLYLLKHIFLFDCKPLDFGEIKGLLRRHDEVIERQRKIYENVNNLQTDEILKKYNRHLKKKQKNINLEMSLCESHMLEDFEKFNAEHTLILCAECKVIKNTLTGRDFVPLDSFSGNSLYDLIEKEHYVSVCAAKQNGKPSIQIKFFYECYLSPQQSETALLINFRFFDKVIFVPFLGIFLKEYIPKLFKCLNTHS